jgi:hypothetical protein
VFGGPAGRLCESLPRGRSTRFSADGSLGDPATGATASHSCGDVEAGYQGPDPSLDVVTHLAHHFDGCPAGSVSSQSSQRFPGCSGQASPQPMVITTSAARTISSVQGFGELGADVDAHLRHGLHCHGIQICGRFRPTREHVHAVAGQVARPARRHL